MKKFPVSTMESLQSRVELRGVLIRCTYPLYKVFSAASPAVVVSLLVSRINTFIIT
jgi:hypothetical protein